MRRSPTRTKRRRSTTRSSRRRFRRATSSRTGERRCARSSAAFPQDLKRLGAGFEPTSPAPNSLDAWVDRALADNLNVRIARYNSEIATLEIERQRAGRLPTLDLVASANAQAGTGSVNTNALQRHPAGGDRPRIDGPALSGRIRRVEGPRSACAAGERAAEPGGRAAQCAVQRADGIHRRQQRGRVGQGVRAGARLGTDGVRIEPDRARKSACARISTS